MNDLLPRERSVNDMLRYFIFRRKITFLSKYKKMSHISLSDSNETHYKSIIQFMVMNNFIYLMYYTCVFLTAIQIKVIVLNMRSKDRNTNSVEESFLFIASCRFNGY